MSTCNFGRPQTDADFQNMGVNNELRINDTLKATTTEIQQLCSTIDNSYVMVGSYSFGGSITGSFSTYTLPSGKASETIVRSSPSVYTSFYTDRALRVDKFQVTVIGNSQFSTPITVNVSLASGSVTTSMSDVVTLTIPDVLPTTAQHATYDVNNTESVVIPANSYVSVHIATPNYSIFTMDWSLFITKV